MFTQIVLLLAHIDTAFSSSHLFSTCCAPPPSGVWCAVVAQTPELDADAGRKSILVPGG